ncbi:MAG: sulfite exporter TauE/SafE family protein [Patescibacteria group bacterium]
MNQGEKKYTFHVHGMHCNSCAILIDSELIELTYINNVKSNLRNCCVEVIGNFGDKSPDSIIVDLNEVLRKHDYSLSLEKREYEVKWSDFKIAIPFALGFIAIFIFLQKIGIVNLISSQDVSYAKAFFIGIIASLSTCMAIVGGLVLSLSANFAKGGDRIKSQILFHVGRLVSFFLLGGTIGALGSVFQLGGTGVFILSLIVGVVMLILGINLLDIFQWTKRIQPTLPKFISNNILKVKKLNHTLTPLLLGIATFFLPCGFTQSMQIYTLSTGSFLSGGAIMFVFALGTFPVLALLSFTSLGIHDKVKSGIFFKTAGLVVIFFALFNLINSLVAIGVLSPIFNF